MKKKPVTKQFSRRPLWVWIVGILGIAAAIVMVSGCGKTQTLDTPQTLSKIDKGQVIAEIICSNCHAIGLDDSSRHPDATRFRDISRNYPIEHLAESLAEGIVVGHPDMPEYSFNPDEIDALIDYMKRIQSPHEL